MKKLVLFSLLTLMSFASHAEVVTDSKGNEIVLNPNKTWSYAKKDTNNSNKGKNRVLSKLEKFTATVKDGNEKPVKIDVITSFDDVSTATLTEKQALEFIDFVFFKVGLGLKNKYSLVPKIAHVKMENNTLDIFVKYTAQNSYGADVVGSYSQKFLLDANNKFTPLQ